MGVISAAAVDPFQKLRLLRKCDTGIDINHEDDTPYTTPYQETILKQVENKYCAKYECLPVIKPPSTLIINLFPLSMPS
jgi:hypothetical protein